jgi:MarR family transcriptional regulator, organic hydroperoxide resistance regulator
LIQYNIDVERTSIDSIELFGSLLRSISRRTAARHNLPAVHGDILDYLSRCNGFSNTVMAVAEYLGLTKGTVSQSIKLLAGRDYLERMPDEKDRRVQHLVLTHKGRLYAQDLNSDLQGRLAGIETAGNYTRLLKTILSDLTRQAHGRAPDDSTFGICRTCRFYRRGGEDGGSCAKTAHPVAETDMDLLCRLHAWAD